MWTESNAGSRRCAAPLNLLRPRRRLSPSQTNARAYVLRDSSSTFRLWLSPPRHRKTDVTARRPHADTHTPRPTHRPFPSPHRPRRTSSPRRGAATPRPRLGQTHSSGRSRCLCPCPCQSPPQSPPRQQRQLPILPLRMVPRPLPPQATVPNHPEVPLAARRAAPREAARAAPAALIPHSTEAASPLTWRSCERRGRSRRSLLPCGSKTGAAPRRAWVLRVLLRVQSRRPFRTRLRLRGVPLRLPLRVLLRLRHQPRLCRMPLPSKRASPRSSPPSSRRTPPPSAPNGPTRCTSAPPGSTLVTSSSGSAGGAPPGSCCSSSARASSSSRSCMASACSMGDWGQS